MNQKFKNIALASGKYDNEKNYWLNQLAGMDNFEFPVDYQYSKKRERTEGIINYKFASDTYAQIRKLARDKDYATFMILLAGVKYILHLYTNTPDIAVISPILKQEGQGGYINHLLALRTQVNPELSFKELLLAVKQTTTEAHQNQNYPIEKLAEELGVAASENQLFFSNVVVLLENIHDPSLLTNVNYDLSVAFTVNEAGIECKLTYDQNLYQRETISQFIKHVDYMLQMGIAHKDTMLKDVQLISDQEQEQILADFNQTQTDYPGDKSIHQLFEEQVAQNPHQIALTFEDTQLTYQELNNKSNQLARRLRAQGVGPDQMVGLITERSHEMIIGILAILKAGGAYLPIRPSDPEERIRYMFEDSGVKLVLTNISLPEQLQTEYEVMDLENPELYTGDDTNLEPVGTSENLCYIIYTSGTTGKPKGTLIMHYNVVRVVRETNYIDIGTTDKILQLSNYAFDGSVFDIYGALLNGSQLVLVPEETAVNIDKLAQVIQAEEISVFFVTTSLFNLLVDAKLECLAQVRKVLFGGEKASIAHVRKAFNYLGPGRLINVYGPTESTVYTTCYVINEIAEQENNLSIGAAIANTQVYILDPYHQLQPLGIPGEICISGDGLARGYLNNAELTAEKFVPNPFAANPKNEYSSKLYRTGDLGKMLLDGTIQFLGRIDQQVKIRGYRIELSEIEKVLQEHPAVEEVVVIDGQDQNQNTKYLVGYYIAQEPISVGELREYLLATLPEYMVPAYFVQIDQIPLNANGKTDRKALPEPDLATTEVAYVAPTNELEEKLAQIWSQILKVEQIGIDDDFFFLGGQSFNAMLVASKILEEFGVEISVRQIFESPTIRELSTYISQAEQVEYSLIEPVAEAEYYPVSSAQKRQYIVNQMDNVNINYNVPLVIKLEKELDIDQLQVALEQLVARHESLRTSFEVIEGEIVQIIHEQVEVELTQLLADEANLVETVKSFIRPFDLATAPLLRAGLIETRDELIFILDLHHIITDGFSMNILVDEIKALYAGAELAELQLQYKDFAVWQRNFAESELMEKQQEYWVNKFSDEVAVLNLPLDYARPAVQDFSGARFTFEVDQELQTSLNRLAASKGATLFMTLLSAYNILLAKYSGQEDLIVGSPIAGRHHAGLEKVVGMFVNTLALRTKPSSAKSYDQFLEEVKGETLQATEHQDFQFESLVKMLDLDRDMSRNPLFDVVFSLQNESEIRGKRLAESPVAFEMGIAKFDLTLTAKELIDGIHFEFEYCTKLFKPETIVRFAQHYQNILQQIIANPQISIAEINMLSPEERATILDEFNATQTEYPRQTIGQLFEEQVAQHPERIAITFNDDEITYQQLNEKANQLARTLRAKGIGTDDIVGLMTERSINMLVGILGILKAGGAYLPINPADPAERIKYMVDDSQVSLILAQEHLQTKLQVDAEILNLADPALYTGDSANLGISGSPEDLCYVIYTSGTTGNPKGNLTMHYNVVRVVKNTNYIEFNPEDRVLQLSNYAFDGSVFDIYGALLNGAQLVLIDGETTLNIDRLAQVIKTQGITVFFVTTSLFNLLVETNLDCLENIRKVLFGGERASVEHVRKAVNYLGQDRVIHAYGPTESTVYTTCGVINEVDDHAHQIPIGQAISNTQVYIVDQDHQLQPIGVPGEICIAGDGLSRGYLNNPELTAAKFIDNPFSELEAGAPVSYRDKLYKTGDLGRWLPDGRIEFLDRIDKQVKIRGFRIEMGEIENSILKYPKVKEAVVIDGLNANQTKYLAAYLVPAAELDVAELKEYLLKTLPEYMIPSYFVKLDQLPLNLNGKVDRKSLPDAIQYNELNIEYVAPENEPEEKLVQIWEEILRVEKIGVKDNFFEIGGDSIKAIQIIAKAKQGNLNLSTRDIFKFKTIRDIVKNAELSKEMLQISQAEVEGEVLFTPIQKWFFELDLRYPQYWNQANLFTLDPEVDLQLLADCFKEIIAHHDLLRTVYLTDEDYVMQYNRKMSAVEFELPVIDLSTYSVAEQKEELQKQTFKIQNSLDLEQGLLIQPVVFDLGDQGFRLFVAIHHLIIDGVSWRILLEDLEQLYTSQLKAKLPLKTTSFKEWSQKLHAYAESRHLDLDYWNSIDPQAIQPLQEDAEEEINLKDFQMTQFSLDREATQKLLTQVNQAYNTEIDDILLSALTMAFTQTMHREQILFLLEKHGREEIMDDVDLSRTIGWFTCSFPVYLEQQDQLETTIKYVKENLRKIPNEGMNYGIARYLQGNEQLAALNPEISFNYLGQFDGVIGHQETGRLLSSASESYGNYQHHDEKNHTVMDIGGSIFAERLTISINYNQKFISEEEAVALSKAYQTHLLEIIQHCIEQNQRTYTPADFGAQNLFEMSNFAELGTYPNYQNYENIQSIHPLTSMQAGMLFYCLANEGGLNYSEQMSLHLEGDVDLPLLKQAWQEVFDRHEVFRTDFRWKESLQPVQIILQKKIAEIYEGDLTHLNHREQESYIADFKEQELARGFDFENGQLSRLSLLKVAEDQYFVNWTFHHILLDGWSVQLVIKEFFEIYNHLRAGLAVPDRSKAQFTDYLAWLEKKDQQQSVAFWQNYLNGLTEPTLLPVGDQRGSEQSIREAETVEFEFDQQRTQELNEFCKTKNITSNVLVQACWGLVLQRYNNTNVSCSGMTVSGRPAVIQGEENIVGLFINTLPVVVKVDDKMKGDDLLTQVNNDLVELREYGYLSLPEIENLSQLESGQKMFNTIVVYENYPIQSVSQQSNTDLKVSVDSFFELSNFDLSITVTNSTQMSLLFRYNLSLFTSEEIEQLIQHFVTVMESVVAHPELPVTEIEMLAHEEREELLIGFNQTQTEYRKEQRIHTIFEEQVAKAPEQIALRFGSQELTYRDLNEKANQLARVLRTKGVGRDDIVGLMAEKSNEMIIGILGILKAGGAYLPINPADPEERIRYMLEDSSVSLILAQPQFVDKIQGKIEVMDVADPACYQGDGSNLEVEGTSADLCYVIYTSGTTGKPKGNLTMHYNVVRVVDHTNYIEILPEDRVLQLSNYAFDGSVFDIYGALLNGAQLILIDQKTAANLDDLAQVIEDQQITVSFVTTVLFNLIVDTRIECLNNVRKILFGGERVSVEHARKALDYLGPDRIIHVYGPTESTVYATYYHLNHIDEQATNIPIGAPLANTQIYVLNRDHQLQPIGVPGEICIAGDGLSRGYLNKPELTAEKFIANPFAQGESQDRLYKTGDLGRWLPDGNIEFLDRIDKQVKIRGFRIELGEIESTILKYPNVKEALVIDGVNGDGSKYLAAYLVPDGQIVTEAVREYLADRLPSYMIPAYFVHLDELPLNLNGKVDRKALPQPDLQVQEEMTYIAASTDQEKILQQVWSEVLGIEQIGIRHNFFEIGGDSIKAMQMISKLRRHGYNCQVKNLLLFPTIEDLATKLERLNNYLQAEQGLIEGEVLPSPIQKRILEHDPYERQHHHCIPILLEYKQEIDYEVLKQVFFKLIEHHDALRLNYDVEKQSFFINNTFLEQEFELPVYNLSKLSAKGQDERIEDYGTELMRSINLESDLYFKACIFELGKRGKRLLLVTHHLVWDPVSSGILLEDFVDFLDQILKTGEIKPGLKTTSFKTWTNELFKRGQSAELLQEKAYWEEVLSTEYSLPQDFDKGEDLIKDVGIVSVELDENETQALLTKTNQVYQTETNDLLLTALAMTISEFADSKEVVLQLENNGRDVFGSDLDLSRTVGWFTSIYPVKLNLAGYQKLDEYIVATKGQLRQVPHQGTGYGVLKYLAGADLPDLSREDHVIFNYIGEVGQTLDNDYFSRALEKTGETKDQETKLLVNLGVAASIYEKKLRINFMYSKNKYKKKTVKKLAKDYTTQLLEIINYCSEQI